MIQHIAIISVVALNCFNPYLFQFSIVFLRASETKPINKNNQKVMSDVMCIFKSHHQHCCILV